MNYNLDAVLIEEASRASALAERVLGRLPSSVGVGYVQSGIAAAKPGGEPDVFAAGKRRLILMRHRKPFLAPCPAGSPKFACCGYLILTLASNCPMDCSYCFLQEYLAETPGFKIYSNYCDAFDELDRLRRKSLSRPLRIGTGELADSLAFDSLTGISRDLVEYFSRAPGMLLELKTKTEEIDNLLSIDPAGRTLVSWTLSPDAVFRSSEHRTAPPQARLAAARRVLAAGYKVGFHLDPIIGYAGAERDYDELLTMLFDLIEPERISFISLGGLRMTPALRTIARRRFPLDRMLIGEDLLAADGRYRTIAPLRFKLYRTIADRIRKASAQLPTYLCMETAGAAARVFGAAPPPPAVLGARLASS